MPTTDFRERAQVSYSAVTGRTTIRLPYNVLDDLYIVRQDNTEKLSWTKVGQQSVEVEGDYTNVPLFAGYPFEWRYTFGPAAVLKQTQMGSVASQRYGRTQVNRWGVLTSPGGVYDISVTRDGQLIASKTLTHRRVSSGFDNSPRPDVGMITVLSRADRARVTVSSSYQWPVWVISAWWQGDFTGHGGTT